MPFRFKRTCIVAGLILLFVFATRKQLFAYDALPTTSPSKSVYSDKILVNLKSGVNAKNIIAVNSTLPDAQFQGSIPNSSTLVYKVNGDVQKTVKTASSNSLIDEVRPVPNMFAFDTVYSSDALAAYQWQLDNTHVRLNGSGNSAWNLFNTASNISSKTNPVVVAVVDTGIKTDNVDLTGKIVQSVDCTASGPCQTGGDDDAGHGTHVAGIIGANPNTIGIAGAGWNVKLISVKALGADGSGAFTNVVNALNWIADNADTKHIKVVNLSLGMSTSLLTPTDIIDVQNTIDRVWNKGIVIVAAAGNCADSTTYMTMPECNGLLNTKNAPASFNHVISVAALDINNVLAPYSEHNDSTNGNWIDISAPGGRGKCGDNDFTNCIVSLCHVSDFCIAAGTSQATPVVSGIAALMYAINPNITNSQIQSIFENQSDSSIASGSTNFGAVNAYRAVLAAQSSVSISPQPSETPGGNAPTNTPIPTQITTTPIPTTTAFPTPTITNTPTPTITPYPTTGPAVLPRIMPNPPPDGPYCPNIVDCPLKYNGDANCDGAANYDDYQILLSQYDKLTVPIRNKSNSNFICMEKNTTTYFIDMTDFEKWRRNAIVHLVIPSQTPSPTP